MLRLSTPSLGITREERGGRLRSADRAFNSLSRDHPGSSGGFASKLIPFNSLSRDHIDKLVEIARRPSATFNSLSRDHKSNEKLERSHVHQIFTSSFNSLSRDHSSFTFVSSYSSYKKNCLSTPSLGITPRLRSISRNSSGTFNSLSRDHVYDICARYQGYQVTFNSLSRDHCSSLTSSLTIVSFSTAFQLPLSGSLHRGAAGGIWVGSPDFQLPLSGSLELDARLVRDARKDFQLPLSGSLD